MTAGQPDGRPFLRVVRGEPDAAELAALVSVIQAGAVAAAQSAAQLAAAAPTPRPDSQWAAPARLVRPNVGPVGWWQMGLPR